MQARAIVTRAGHLELIDPTPRPLAVGTVVMIDLPEEPANTTPPARSALELAGCLSAYTRPGVTVDEMAVAVEEEAGRLFERGER